MRRQTRQADPTRDTSQQTLERCVNCCMRIRRCDLHIAHTCEGYVHIRAATNLSNAHLCYPDLVQTLFAEPYTRD